MQRGADELRVELLATAVGEHEADVLVEAGPAGERLESAQPAVHVADGLALVQMREGEPGGAHDWG